MDETNFLGTEILDDWRWFNQRKRICWTVSPESHIHGELFTRLQMNDVIDMCPVH